mmetsp:Transcript_22154/g.50927  ORF Transcript_22154/g.50927 Transcript_22154/m.50927 type:complete len:202 (-) Transcript_22154:601-1206(-)
MVEPTNARLIGVATVRVQRHARHRVEMEHLLLVRLVVPLRGLLAARNQPRLGRRDRAKGLHVHVAREVPRRPREPRQPELEQALERLHEQVPPLLGQHVLLHQSLGLLVRVQLPVRRAHVADEERPRARELARHLVSEEFLPEHDAWVVVQVRVEGRGVDKHEVQLRESVRKEGDVRAGRCPGVHDRVAKARMLRQELELG